MRILVTGGAGFIGFHLCLFLAKRGDDVLSVDNINDYYDVNLKFSRLEYLGFLRNDIQYLKIIKSNKFANLKFCRVDLLDKNEIIKINKDFDCVVNLAAQAGVRYSLINPQAYIDSNITGFLNILESCRLNGIQNLVFASSSSVYGLNEDMPFNTNSNTSHPVSLYAVSKKSNELMAHSYSSLFNIACTGLRFFSVYGKWGRPDMALFLFVDAAFKNKKINVFNYGNMKRDFTYIDDLIFSIVKCIDNPAKKCENFF